MESRRKYDDCPSYGSYIRKLWQLYTYVYIISICVAATLHSLHWRPQPACRAHTHFGGRVRDVEKRFASDQ